VESSLCLDIGAQRRHYSNQIKAAPFRKLALKTPDVSEISLMLLAVWSG
jgi:hypothetical protein